MQMRTVDLAYFQPNLAEAGIGQFLDICQRRAFLEDKKHKNDRFVHKERFVHLIKRFVHLRNIIKP